MKSIRVQNLRSLEDTGYIDLKPITLLIGQNSSGKSTFLRTFPLMRQSTETRSSGPILWYGQYVDFGDFGEALRKSSSNAQIGLGFQVNLDENYLKSTYLSGPVRSVLGVDQQEPIEEGLDKTISLDIKIAWDAHREIAYTKSYSLDFFDHIINIDITNLGEVEKFSINSRDLTSLFSNARFLNRGSVLPSIIFLRENTATHSREEKPLYELRKKLKSFMGKKTTTSTLEKITSAWKLGNSNQILETMQKSGEFFDAWKMEVYTWTTNSEAFLEIKNLWLASISYYIMSLLEEYLRRFCSNVKYVAPVRAIAERFYRVQNLAIDEPDYQGRNLPMYLRNLSEAERNSFSNWTETLFGFSIQTESKSGHTSLYLKDIASGEKNNLTDTGFGYSQILPILVQLWSSVEKRIMGIRRFKSPILIAIEQPELHLHPKMQAQLADAFVKVVDDSKKRGIDIILLLETHSQTIINRLGHLVMGKYIKPEDINLIIFEKDDYSSPSKIRIGAYDSEGYLSNWPYGFFEPDEVK